MQNKILFLKFLSLVCVPHVCPAIIVVDGEASTSSWIATPWSSDVSGTDLINSGQMSLASTDVSHTDWGLGGMNDGNSIAQNIGTNTWYNPLHHNVTFPIIATYNLNISSNTNGYDITAIETFMGWHEHTEHQANQTYKVEVRTVGSPDYILLTNVDYTPFLVNSEANASYHYSHVDITEDNTGILASGVDSIRFTFFSPGTVGISPGTVIRELDVHGSPTPVPEPMSIGLVSLVALSAAILHRRDKASP